MKVLPAGQKMARLHVVGSVATYTTDAGSSLNHSGIIRLLSMDRTNGYEHSYRSLANQSFESTSRLSYRAWYSPTTLGNFPGHGSLTSIDSSCYFSDTF